MRLCFIDLETTGTNIDLHHLWEIGLIVRDLPTDPDLRALHPAEWTAAATDATNDLEYAWQVWPDMQFADPQALRVGRFYERKQVAPDVPAFVLQHATVGEGSREAKQRTGQTDHFSVAAELAELLDGALLANIQVGFDAGFLAKFLKTCGYAPTWNYHLIDLLSLAGGRWRITPPWTSSGITSQLGLPNAHDRHTGLGDARLARDIFSRVYATG